ncbi:MAG: Zn-dependent hydrolase [Gemmatimonadota bacterium]
MRMIRVLFLTALVFGCDRGRPAASSADGAGSRPDSGARTAAVETIPRKLARYTPVRLTADVSRLSPKEQEMVPLLIAAARLMDSVYWLESSGPRDSVLKLAADSGSRRLIDINYGPWDRLDGDAPFVPEAGAKPKGANFYPHDITTAEFEAAATGPNTDSLKSQYTLVRRENGKLVAGAYHVAFEPWIKPAAAKLRSAAALAEDPGLRKYLELRATALETDDYQPSDFAWLAMKNNTLDVVIGPIESYEDGLFGYKAAHEAYVLIKDKVWSKRLARYASLLPSLQQALPVKDEYKREKPGTDSDLNAYDAVFYAGQANAGAKTIAINLPNDEQVQLKKGTRRLQLKNAMKAKFDKILMPIADELVAADQRGNISFDAFFEDVMFHEVAHGLGIKNTIDGEGTVRAALKERASALEEEKADVLGLFMVTQLNDRHELSENLLDNYVTFLAGLFRSVRFGAADAHGRANMSEFNFLLDHGAFVRDSVTGTYRVDLVKMRAGINDLAALILTYQGNGDYAGVGSFYDAGAKINPALQADLSRLSSKGIPVDIVFEQGADVVGSK